MNDDVMPAERITALAADQHGAVHRQQLLQAGLTGRSVDGLVRRRWLRPAVHGAADALQLGAALVWANGRPEGRSLCTLDDRLAQAAQREGFIVV